MKIDYKELLKITLFYALFYCANVLYNKAIILYGDGISFMFSLFWVGPVLLYLYIQRINPIHYLKLNVGMSKRFFYGQLYPVLFMLY